MTMYISHVHLHVEVLVIQKKMNCARIATSYAHSEFVTVCLRRWLCNSAEVDRRTIPPKRRWVPQWAIFGVTESWYGWLFGGCVGHGSESVVAMAWFQERDCCAVLNLCARFSGPIKSAIVSIVYNSRLLSRLRIYYALSHSTHHSYKNLQSNVTLCILHHRHP